MAPNLPDDLKVRLQGYITGCYGSLTSFNVLFADEDDQFKGVGRGLSGSRVHVEGACRLPRYRPAAAARLRWAVADRNAAMNVSFYVEYVDDAY